MVIDENKLMTPYNIKQERFIHSDHCSIMVNLNWLLKSEEIKQLQNIKINNETLKKFFNKTNGKILTETVKREKSAKEKYKKWQDKINVIIKECFQVKKKKDKLKTPYIRKLMGRRRKLRKILKDKKNRSKKRSILIQCKLIDKMIFTEKQKVITNNISTEIQKLKVGGGINSGAFWEFKKRMEKNKHRDVLTAIIGKDKELKTTKEEIKKEYENFYSHLFTKTEIIDKRGKEMIDIKMRNLKKVAKQDKETITDISVKELRENVDDWNNDPNTTSKYYYNDYRVRRVNDTTR